MNALQKQLAAAAEQLLPGSRPVWWPRDSSPYRFYLHPPEQEAVTVYLYFDVAEDLTGPHVAVHIKGVEQSSPWAASQRRQYTAWAQPVVSAANALSQGRAQGRATTEE